MKILITGGAGFIGSHFTKMALAGELGIEISELTVLDKLTYAGKLENLSPLQMQQDFKFVQGDITDANSVDDLTKNTNIKYPISFEKLIRMYKNVLANGFTSYAEA
jgi:dTDP-glucose 4,6-dehydratase